MATFDVSDWYNDVDNGWVNVELAGGPLVVSGGNKKLLGTVLTINELGFWRSGGTLSDTDYIFQIDFTPSAGIENIVALAGISIVTGLSSTNTVNVLFNTFLAGQEIRLNDYGETQVSGGTPVSNLQIGTKYTIKLQINVDGTVTGYIDSSGAGISNQSLGTTTTATDLHNAIVYFSAQQTIILPGLTSDYSQWDNFVVHDEGLNFSLPSRNDVNLDSYDWDLKELYTR